MSSSRIKNTFSSIGELDASVLPSSLVLKLGITDRYIRYFVQSLAHEQIIFFGDYSLYHIESTETLVQHLEKIVENDDILQLSFAKIFIGIDPTYSLIPSGFYSEVEPSEYLTLNQKIEPGGLDMVFKIESQFYDKLKRLFTNCSVTHINASLLTVLPLYSGSSADKLFANISPSFVDIIHFSDSGQVQLMNRYEYKTETDFIYFILLCCRELKIDRESSELVLCGEIDVQSQVYEICNRYFRNISFVQQTPGIHFSKAFNSYPKYLHYNLYNLHA